MFNHLIYIITTCKSGNIIKSLKINNKKKRSYNALINAGGVCDANHKLKFYNFYVNFYNYF